MKMAITTNSSISVNTDRRDDHFLGGASPSSACTNTCLPTATGDGT